jgi:DNA-binding NtrC family response regulator
MLNDSQSPSQHHLPNSRGQASADHEDSAKPSLPPFVCTPFVCVSSALRRLLLQAEITAPRLHIATLEGEAGTGKHLFAQILHFHSQPASLAFRRRDTREWLANEADISSLSGTLYLDRVDLLAPAGQGLLLNFVKMLQADTAPAHFLLLASTHASLRLLASQGHFLPDLAFRLTAVRFSIPPLCEHREDIAPITQALIDRICRHYRQPTAVLAPGTLPRLLQHNWPGNVRELASALEAAILDSTTGILHPNDLLISPRNEIIAPAFPNSALKQAELHENQTEDMTLDAAIRRHIQLILTLNHGNKLRSSRQLGISRSTLYRLLAGEAISTETL